MSTCDGDWYYRCNWLVAEDGRITPLTDDVRRHLTSDVVDKMSAQGLRTISIAFRDFVSGRRRLVGFSVGECKVCDVQLLTECFAVDLATGRTLAIPFTRSAVSVKQNSKSNTSSQ